MDKDRMRGFMARFMEMAGGSAVMGVIAVADRTGLFGALAGKGPLSHADIERESGLDARYLTEILSTLAAAGILEYDAAAETFTLPDEHAACLADESSPYFLAGWSQMMPALHGAVPGVARACREGGGVPFSDFGADMVDGIARSNGPGTRILLARKWLAVMPDLVARLHAGLHVADLGCGAGAAVLTMARAYPASQIQGFDVDPLSIERAEASAAEEGLTNATFAVCDAEALPAEPGFDLITTFDVIHDLARPRPVLARIRRALRPGGTYLMVEPAVGDRLEDNLDMGGALTYAMSTLHCMTQSLAQGGEGLGAAWGARRAEDYCREAGFEHFERLDVPNPFNAFYRLEV